MNASLIVNNVTWIKREMTISVGVSVKIKKNTICRKKFIFGTLQHEAANGIYIGIITDDSVITCDEIID